MQSFLAWILYIQKLLVIIMMTLLVDIIAISGSNNERVVCYHYNCLKKRTLTA